MDFHTFNLSIGFTYSENFVLSVYNTLKYEGGFSDDVDDRGGKTKYGISTMFLEDNEEKLKEKRVFPDDIKYLTLEDAVYIYYRFFWIPLQCDKITDTFVSGYLFDTAVNSGIHIAVKLLQKSANATKKSDKLVVDGIIGSKTINRVNGILQKNEEPLPFIFREMRVKYYVAVVKRRNRNLKFLSGWIDRAFGWNNVREIS